MTDIALAQARARQEAIQAQQRRPDEEVGYATKAIVEPNEKGQKRIDAERADAIARGEDPPENFYLAPDERGDVVVMGYYRVIRRTTPSGLALPQGAEAVIDFPDKEISRRSYATLSTLVSAAFGEKPRVG